MKRNRLRIEYHDDILPAVSGRVFHVTPSANMPHIRVADALVPNVHLLNASGFGYRTNGFFRKRGCVSFFDYRCTGTPEWEAHAYKCFPAQFLDRGDTMSVLFLSDTQFARLIPWTAWRDERAWSDQIVPWIEAGYHGDVSLKHITEELIVEYVRI